jgi:hypothetical protein
MKTGHDAGVKLSAVTAKETASTTNVPLASTASRGKTASMGRKPATTSRRSALWADRMMKAPQRAARKATVMVTIEAPWTSFIVVSTSPPPGSPMSRGVGCVRAIARVMKKNGSTTKSTSSSGRRACSRNPSRVAVATRAFMPGSWRTRRRRGRRPRARRR